MLAHAAPARDAKPAAAAPPHVPHLSSLRYAPGRVLVRLNPQQAAGPAAAAAAGGGMSVAGAHAALGGGLRLLRLVGKDAALQVAQPPSSGNPTAASAAGMAAAAAGAAATKLPADALMLLEITDGSDVMAKVRQLKTNKGKWQQICDRLVECMRRCARHSGAAAARGDALAPSLSNLASLLHERRICEHTCSTAAAPLPAAVALAQPEWIYHSQAAPNDAMYGAAERSSGLWFLEKIQAPTAWDTTAGSTTVGVCM